MKKAIVWFVCCAVVLTGCFDVTTKVKVKPDGSGTLEQTFLMSKAAIEMGQAGKKKKEPVHNPAQLKKEAAQLGSGVEYVSSRKVSAGDFEGYTVIYKFSDINALKLSDDFGEKAAPKRNSADGAAPRQKTYTTFSFQKGTESELVITMPPRKPSEKSDQTDNEKSDAASDSVAESGLAMMRLFFKGMKIATYIEPQGEIVSTDAHLRDGNRITLAEVEFEKMFADTSSLRYLKNMKDNSSPEAIRDLMRNVPGVKFEVAEKIMVKFK